MESEGDVIPPFEMVDDGPVPTTGSVKAYVNVGGQ
jgi:hypothetical protein